MAKTFEEKNATRIAKGKAPFSLAEFNTQRAAADILDQQEANRASSLFEFGVPPPLIPPPLTPPPPTVLSPPPLIPPPPTVLPPGATFTPGASQSLIDVAAANALPPPPPIPTTLPPADVTTPGGEFTPEAFTVAPEALVEDRLTALVAKGSPLLAQAEAFARMKAQGEGRLLSSVAAGEAQEAILRQGLNIVTPDAATFDRAATNTIAAINAAKADAARFVNQGSLDLALARINQDTNLAVADRNNLTALIVAQGNQDTQKVLESMGNIATFAGQTLAAGTSIAIANADNVSRQFIQQLIIDNEQALQGNVIVANAFTNTVTNSIAALTADVGPALKQDMFAAIQGGFDATTEFLEETFPGLNLGELGELSKNLGDLRGTTGVAGGTSEDEGSQAVEVSSDGASISVNGQDVTQNVPYGQEKYRAWFTKHDGSTQKPLQWNPVNQTFTIGDQDVTTTMPLDLRDFFLVQMGLVPLEGRWRDIPPTIRLGAGRPGKPSTGPNTNRILPWTPEMTADWRAN